MMVNKFNDAAVTEDRGKYIVLDAPPRSRRGPNRCSATDRVYSFRSARHRRGDTGWSRARFSFLLLVPLLYVLALARPAEAEVVLDPTYCNGGKMDELCLGRAIVEANSADQYKTHPHYGEQYVIFLGQGDPGSCPQSPCPINIKLKRGLPTVTTKNNALYIIGDGAALTTIRGPCTDRNEEIGHCDSDDAAPVLQVAKDASLVIESITVTNGDPGIWNEGYLYAYWSTIAYSGNHQGAGGIVNVGPYLYLQDSTVSHNHSHHGPGGGITNYQEGL